MPLELLLAPRALAADDPSMNGAGALSLLDHGGDAVIMVVVVVILVIWPDGPLTSMGVATRWAFFVLFFLIEAWSAR